MEATYEQVRRCEHGSGERDKGRNRGECDDRERDQAETRHDQDDERHPTRMRPGIRSNPYFTAPPPSRGEAYLS